MALLASDIYKTRPPEIAPAKSEVFIASPSQSESHPQIIVTQEYVNNTGDSKVISGTTITASSDNIKYIQKEPVKPISNKISESKPSTTKKQDDSERKSLKDTNFKRPVTTEKLKQKDTSPKRKKSKNTSDDITEEKQKEYESNKSKKR